MFKVLHTSPVGGMRLTPLQWETLRWADMLGGLERVTILAWTYWGNMPRREYVDRFMVPTALEDGQWREADSQVRVLKRLRLLKREGQRWVLSDAGYKALQEKPRSILPVARQKLGN